MNSKSIRHKYFDFFKSNQHSIVPSAPMVLKDDPTLMFTNAGMNQFKDIFLGNSESVDKRVANTQKCLRVSGKHNDLEEVGYDTYHHTMFEMLGNWSFGDYFKEEAIDMAWKFLVEMLKVDKERIYVTIFEGDNNDGTEPDKEAYSFWTKYLDDERILSFSKKDNFWEMGDTGPCGPCSEIHYDIRDDEERRQTPGKDLVNKDHPKVIEIWNLVFIQYNRKKDGTLTNLPKKHIDTGMGFERLCMVMQGVMSNYDTDIFQPIIQAISAYSNVPYGKNDKTDIAIRVVADHLRAVAFSIADGQLPSNTKAGYVIRRILRRAIRYNYTFLGQNEPVIYKLIEVLADVMGDTFDEIKNQQELIGKVILDEEKAFLKTLDSGIHLLEGLMKTAKTANNTTISGKKAFELYDTFGFPLDLTELILKENGLGLNIEEFNVEMKAQRDRSKKASESEMTDWIILNDSISQSFTGYEELTSEAQLTKYRKVKDKKGKEFYHLIFDKSPFYGESGGQIGDSGHLESEGSKISIIDTVKENNLNLHIAPKLPDEPKAPVKLHVNKANRTAIANNHTATHLLHYALRKVLGGHVEQKGSLVHYDYLRFDFSHFQKIEQEELDKVEQEVNRLIRSNIPLTEFNDISMSKAKNMGAMALFGEKYGDKVRVIKFGDSVELCGGTHVCATGEIGVFKIISESSIAAGIRRLQAITSTKAEAFINEKLKVLSEIEGKLNNPKNLVKAVDDIVDKNIELQKKIESFEIEKLKDVKQRLKDKIVVKDGVSVLIEKVDLNSSALVKDLAFQLKNEIENLFMVVGANFGSKAHLSVMISENLTKDKDLNAGKIVKEIAKEIQGGGGGQVFYATAGGKKPEGIHNALKKAMDWL